eukprot:TRINITY_DN1660_c0_g2_i1.p1 TRINITY_DN1660_c0_g2~~TRINITY_DN1660_c0_g2_i1.p1  ORF type:complete len:267 (+),score=63.53 TRINITY_DN1660_c0_g2_i1:227-1027(+)
MMEEERDAAVAAAVGVSPLSLPAQRASPVLEVVQDLPAPSAANAAAAAAAAAAANSAEVYSNALPPADAMVVVDMGFSFTHVFCFYKGRALQHATVRLNVGGKLLTNYLKEVLSYRQLNVMDEFDLVTQAMESTCYVAQDFKHDMLATRGLASPAHGPIVREFVLPDYKNVLQGYVRDPSEFTPEQRREHMAEDAPQSLRLESERFAVPELLFKPSDIGIKQAGVAECIVQAIHKCPPFLQPVLPGNVLLTGGCANFPGLQVMTLI